MSYGSINYKKAESTHAVGKVQTRGIYRTKSELNLRSIFTVLYRLDKELRCFNSF